MSQLSNSFSVRNIQLISLYTILAAIDVGFGSNLHNKLSQIGELEALESGELGRDSGAGSTL